MNITQAQMICLRLDDSLQNTREADASERILRELEWGIEEEGCFSKRTAEADEEGILIRIGENGGVIFADEDHHEKPLIKATMGADDLKAWRTLGKNAARYLKAMPLLFEEG